MWEELGNGILVALGGALVGGVGYAVKLLIGLTRDVGDMKSSIKTVYQAQLLIIKADKSQNAALRGIGANGETRASDQYLTRAMECFDEELLKKVGGDE